MAVTQRNNPTVELIEYSRIEDSIETGLQLGQHEFEAAEIAAEADVEIELVFETMKHLCGKHKHVQETGVGRWTITEE